MRFLLALLLTVPATFVPVAAAHSCSGTAADCVCPVPQDGEYHSHAGPSGSCAGGPGGQANAGPGGASATPGAPVVLLLVGVGAVALVASRRA